MNFVLKYLLMCRMFLMSCTHPTCLTLWVPDWHCPSLDTVWHFLYPFYNGYMPCPGSAVCVKVRGVRKKFKPEIILSFEIIAILTHAPSFIFRLNGFIQSLLGRTRFLCWVPWTFRLPLRYQPSLLCHVRDTWVWFSSSREVFITERFCEIQLITK